MRRTSRAFRATGRTAVVAAIVALLLTGCGGSRGSGFHDATQVAGAVGCGDPTETDPGFDATSAVTCTFGGRSATVLWFAHARDFSYWLAIETHYGSAPSLASGPDWAIRCESRTDCEAMAKASNGIVHGSLAS